MKEFFLKEKMLELHIKGRDWAAHGVSLGLFLMKRVPNLSRNFWAAVETLPYSGGPLSLKTFSKGFSSRWLSGKESASNAEDLGLIPELGRSPGEGHGNPLQYSCWRIPWTEEPGGLQSMGSQRVGCDSMSTSIIVLQHRKDEFLPFMGK